MIFLAHLSVLWESTVSLMAKGDFKVVKSLENTKKSQKDVSLKELLDNTSRPLLCLEVNPPRGTNVEEIISRYVGHVEHLDFFNVTDSALARMRCAALPFAAMLKVRTGIEPLVNLSCRDRNILALQADLLAAWANGVRGLVALTGDAMSVGDCPELKGVFEVNSVGLLGLINKLNTGVDFAEKPLDGSPQFSAGVVLNPNAKNSSAELRRLEKKVSAGASFALTQPVFDAISTRPFMESASAMGIPIFAGLLPFRTGRAALNVIEQVPGIKLPAEMETRFRSNPEEDCTEFFMQHCLELASSIKGVVRGFHVISGLTPKLALRLTKQLSKMFSAESHHTLGDRV